MSYRIVAKSVAIAIIAAIAAGLSIIVLFAVDGLTDSFLSLAVRLFGVALLGSFAIGLPVALVSLHFWKEHLVSSPKIVFLLGNAAGAILLLFSFMFGHIFGGVLFGLPSLIAANVFAALGWTWILKPRSATSDD